MYAFIRWCNNNQGFVSALLAISSLLVSMVAIVISIVTAQKQRKDQLLIAKRQEVVQKRQIKVDSYPYRYECWRVLTFLKEISEGINYTAKVADFYSKSPAQLITIFEILMNAIPNTSSELLMLLLQNKAAISRDLWADINEVHKLFDSISSAFNYLKIYDKNLLNDEELNQLKNESIRTILMSNGALNTRLTQVMKSLDEELYIGDLHK
jgi:hypothetical protein